LVNISISSTLNEAKKRDQTPVEFQKKKETIIILLAAIIIKKSYYIINLFNDFQKKEEKQLNTLFQNYLSYVSTKKK